MDARVHFDEWILDTQFTTQCDEIFEVFSKVFNLEHILLVLDLNLQVMENFVSTFSAHSYSIEGSDLSWVPLDRLMSMQRTKNEQKVINRCLAHMAPWHRACTVPTGSAPGTSPFELVERDAALAAYLLALDLPMEEGSDDEDAGSRVPSIAYKEEEPVEEPIDLEEEYRMVAEQGLALIEPTFSEEPISDNPNLASLTPIEIDGV